MEIVLHEILKKYWNHNSFRPLQLDIIKHVISNKDTIALLPTGGGKSVCFQVPAIFKEGLCIVVTPLIALMSDQTMQLLQKGIPAAYLHNAMRFEEIDITLNNAMKGRYKFLYVSPERLKSDIMIERAKQMKINLLAIDEAHCISQWGYDFRPSYLQISEFRNHIGMHIPTIALTASATPLVIDDIADKLKLENHAVFKKSFTRSNLSYSCLKEENKDQRLLAVLERVQGSAIIYVKTRKKTKETSEWLKKNKISADYYHAGLDFNTRNEKQANWIKGITRVMVSTNAFGMGIDKPDVRTVIHLDIPESPEAYYQEAGRAGRDGKLSFAVILWQELDIESLNENLAVNFPEINFIKKVYQCLANYYKLAVGSAHMASYDFQLVDFTNTYNLPHRETYSALKRLEAEGFIQFNEAFHSPSKLHIFDNSQLLYEFQVANQELDIILKAVLRTYGGELFSNFVNISEHVISKNAEQPMHKVFTALEKMHALGILIYEKQKDRPQMVFTTSRMDAAKLPLNIGLYEKLKSTAILKKDSMIAYVSQKNACRNSLLVKYFGEKEPTDCGICDYCLKNKKKNKPSELKLLEKEILLHLSNGPSTEEEMSKAIFFKRKSDLAIALRELIEQKEIILFNFNQYKLP